MKPTKKNMGSKDKQALKKKLMQAMMQRKMGGSAKPKMKPMPKAPAGGMKKGGKVKKS